MSVAKCLAGTVAALLPSLFYCDLARADEHMVLVDTIDVNSAKGLGAFDISYVDPRLGLYVLADRTNASIDFFDSRYNSFIGRVGGFKGVVLNADGTANNALSGPDGVTVVAGKEIWGGDGDSTVKVINIATFKVTDTISTGGQKRCDEMAWDAADHLLAVANNADTPPFVTLINTDTHQIVGKITFDGTHGTPDATSTGIEQPQWSPRTGMFYVSVPQIDPKDATQGGVTVIDPTKLQVAATFPVSNCSPAGLTIGPGEQALIGCSASFGTAPKVLTQSLVISTKDGRVLKSFPQVGGSDEVWYDPATHHYYLAARNNTDSNGKPAPVLGTIDAITLQYDGGAATSTSAHSVAADRYSHHVFVPIGSTTGTSDPTNPCPTTGCIAVFLPSAVDYDDLAKR